MGNHLSRVIAKQVGESAQGLVSRLCPPGPTAQSDEPSVEAAPAAEAEAEPHALLPIEAEAIRVCRDLAVTQALNPGERDNVGLSNAYYGLGFGLAMAGDAKGCAALLLLHPHQAEAAGVDLSELARLVIPKNLQGSGVHRQVCRTVLAEKREEHNGSLAWAAGDGHVVMYGIGLQSADKSALARHGEWTPQGYRIPTQHLTSLLGVLDKKLSLTNREGLEALAATVPQVIPAAMTQARQVYEKPPFGVQVLRVNGSILTFKGTEYWGPFWAEAKARNGHFNYEEKSIDIGFPHLPGLIDALDRAATREGKVLDLEPLRAYLDQVTDVAPPIATAEIIERTGTTLAFKLSMRYDPAWQVLKAMKVGARFDFERTAIVIPKPALEAYLKRFEDDESVDLGVLLPELADYLAEQKVVLEERLAQVEEIPATTPTGKTLFGHQGSAVAYLLTAGWDRPKDEVMGGILADDMGLGKTLSSIIAANLRTKGTGKVIVVCPATAKGNWEEEIRKWIGAGERIQVLNGRSAKVDLDARWCITNYDILPALKPQLRELQPEVAILDEAHVLRNRDTQRTKAILGLTTAKAKRAAEQGQEDGGPGILEGVPMVWALTGTPILNRPKELWPLLRATGHPEGKSFWRYAKAHCAAYQDRYGWHADGASNLKELSAKLKTSYLRRLKSEVLNLPPKIPQRVEIELTAAETKEYRALVQALLDRETESGNDDSILREINALKQVTARIKLARAIEMAEEIVESGHKVLIFSNYNKVVLDPLEEHFKGRCLRIDGSVPSQKRKGIQDQFQTDPEKTVFLGNTEAAGVNLTLTAATYVIHVDFPWVPGIKDQASDRTYRIGQTGTVTVLDLVAANTFDATLLDILEAKGAVIEAFNQGNAEEAEFAGGAKTVMREVLQSLRAKERAAKKSDKAAAKEAAKAEKAAARAAKKGQGNPHAA